MSDDRLAAGTCAYRLVAEGRDFSTGIHWFRATRQRAPGRHLDGGRVTASETDLAEPEDYLEHMLEEEP